MKFELLVIRCLLILIEVIGSREHFYHKMLNQVENELLDYERNLKQQRLFEETH